MSESIYCFRFVHDQIGCQIINLKEADKYERNRCKLSQRQN